MHSAHASDSSLDPLGEKIVEVTSGVIGYEEEHGLDVDAELGCPSFQPLLAHLPHLI